MINEQKPGQQEALEGLFLRTGMYTTRNKYCAVVDFLNGYDTCSGSLDLQEGFQGWLVKKLGWASCGLLWPWLALRLFPGYENFSEGEGTFPGFEREFIEGLWALLQEYLDHKDDVETADSGQDSDDDFGGDACQELEDVEQMLARNGVTGRETFMIDLTAWRRQSGLLDWSSDQIRSSLVKW